MCVIISLQNNRSSWVSHYNNVLFPGVALLKEFGICSLMTEFGPIIMQSFDTSRSRWLPRWSGVSDYSLSAHGQKFLRKELLSRPALLHIFLHWSYFSFTICQSTSTVSDNIIFCPEITCLANGSWTFRKMTCILLVLNSGHFVCVPLLQSSNVPQICTSWCFLVIKVGARN